MDTFKLIGTGGAPHATENNVCFQAAKDDYLIVPIISLDGEPCISLTHIFYNNEPLAVINIVNVDYLGKEVTYFSSKYKKEFKFKLKTTKYYFS